MVIRLYSYATEKADCEGKSYAPKFSILSDNALHECTHKCFIAQNDACHTILSRHSIKVSGLMLTSVTPNQRLSCSSHSQDMERPTSLASCHNDLQDLETPGK